MMNNESVEAAIRSAIHGMIEPQNSNVETVSRLVALFSSGDHVYSDEQLDLFDDVFETILSGLENAALEVLSPHIATTTQTPPKLLKRFALNKAAPIAGPVLQSHPRIPDEILIEVAETRDEEHLKFLSLRKELSVGVTTPLIIRGSEIVLSQVISNMSAQFSPTGMQTLVERSARIDALAEKLAQRPGLPRAVGTQLITLASQSIKEKFKARFPLASATVEATLDAVSESVATKTILRTHDFHSARRRVLQIKTGKRVNEKDFIYLVRQQDIEGTIVALGDMTNVNLEMVAKLLHDPEHLSIIALLRAANINWEMTREFLKLRTQETQFEVDLKKINIMFRKLTPTLAWSVVDAKCYTAARKNH